MHDNPEFMPFKIDAIVAEPKTVQGPPVPLEFPEAFEIGFHDLLRQPAELAQNVQLQFLRHLRQFDRARWVEDDLKWPHGDFFESLRRVQPTEQLRRLPQLSSTHQQRSLS